MCLCFNGLHATPDTIRKKKNNFHIEGCHNSIAYMQSTQVQMRLLFDMIAVLNEFLLDKDMLCIHIY